MPNEDRDYHNTSCRNVVALALVAIVAGVSLLVAGGRHAPAAVGRVARLVATVHHTRRHHR
jgi:hypothetical protein